MITIVAHMECEAGTEQDVVDAARWFVPATRAEPGCLGFDLHRGLDEPTRFVWYETFRDREAVDAHVASAHVARWFALVEELGARNTYALYARLDVPDGDGAGIMGAGHV